MPIVIEVIDEHEEKLEHIFEQMDTDGIEYEARYNVKTKQGQYEIQKETRGVDNAPEHTNNKPEVPKRNPKGRVVIEIGELTPLGQDKLKDVLDTYFGVDHSVEIDADIITFKPN